MKIGVDLGGTKIEILAIDEQGNECLRNRIDTPGNNYQKIISSIADLVSTAEKKLAKDCTVGICTPGSISPATELLRNSNTTCLNGQPFKQDLENILGKGVRIANDANCFALSEAVDGSAQDANTVFGVIIGTGTGGGLVVDQKVLMGRNAIAGEWGHNPLPWPEEGELELTTCWCGQRGCIETFLSGPGFESDYQRITQKKISAEKIVELSVENDITAEEVIKKYEHRMARGFAHLINIFDPDVIVLGGGMSNIKRIYKNVPELWAQWIFSDCVNTKLVPPTHGDSSGVRGAAWLWNEYL